MSTHRSRAIARGLALVLAVAGVPAFASDAPVRSSALDYTDPAARHHPVTCKEGDREREPGRSLGDVFGEQWPEQPRPLPGGETRKAHVRAVQFSRDIVRGAPAQRGLVVVAVLVDPAGKPLAARPICATTDGYDNKARRLALRSFYEPALVNGQAVTSVAMLIVPFAGGAR